MRAALALEDMGSSQCGLAKIMIIRRGKQTCVGQDYARYIVVVVITLVTVSATIRPNDHYIVQVPYPDNYRLD